MAAGPSDQARGPGLAEAPGWAASYWLASAPPDPGAPLAGDRAADVAIVGAGFTGLWTAIELKRRDPAMAVTVMEKDVAGFGASGRNGGFVEPSLTHGLVNGLRHFPDEMAELERLGRENLAGMARDFERHGIVCDFEPTGMLDVAVRPHQVAELEEYAALAARNGLQAELLSAAEARRRLHSPLFLGALHRPRDGGVLHPGKLARDLRRVAAGLGVEIWERTPVTALRRSGAGVELAAPGGRVRASSAVLATNGYSGRLLRRTLRHFAPVYDHVLVSDPLTREQMEAIGWSGREGVSDAGNRFHYFRLTADDRILWGGYDAVYHFNNGVGDRFDLRAASHDKLLRHFFDAFPQLAGLSFPHRWGGCIATTTRFTPVFGAALGGRLLYALGYTGLGVAATRFAARVLADRLLAPGSALLELDWVRSAPFPFPPEPLRYLGIAMVSRALERSDLRDGRRGVLLGALDRLGIGFDS
ncbi:MAG: NAD(P)/FAD-dependent oxidoreductase [Candidatus Dormibacteraceae bacterium]